MWLKAVPSSIVECSPHHHVFLLPSSPSPSSSLPSRTFHHPTIRRRTTIRPSCCSINSDGNSSNSYREQLAKKTQQDQGHMILNNNNKRHCAASKNTPFFTHTEDRDSSFLPSPFNFLEPMMLGVKPEFPDWPDVGLIEQQKANSLDIPLCLRTIKEKLQSSEEDGLINSRDSDSSTYCSVKTAFSMMAFIIIELQSHALHMREALCHEDLDVITSKVTKEMHSSFVWLFQQVFSKTPALMLDVMVLLADFSVYSASNNIVPKKQSQFHPIERSQKSSSYLGGDNQLGNNNNNNNNNNNDLTDEELNLWYSMVDDAKKMAGGVDGEVLLDHESMKYFVSPVTVEIEPDYLTTDLLRTDLLYQMNLSQDPNHPLLLFNYARFLHLVAHDHDRAEECYKRAVQVSPPDAECLSQYGMFLWMVRKDYTAAEEMFVQSLAIEPNNPDYFANYTHFLLSTGNEETCFPLNN